VLDAGFATADAENVCVDYKSGRLVLRFIDWQNRVITIQFIDVAAYCWQDDAKLPRDVRDDEPYEVGESPRVRELSELGAVWGAHRHHKLCFNACGVLDVVATSLSVQTS